LPDGNINNSITSLPEIFSGDPSSNPNNLRWGDQMSVRGSGANTEILLDNSEGSAAAIVKTNTSTGFYSNFWFATASGNSSIGRQMQFGPTNTLWQKRAREGLTLTKFDTNAHTSVRLANIDNLSVNLGALSVDPARNLAVGIDHTSATVPALVFYDLSDPATPMLISRTNFPGSTGNGNFIGKVIISGNKVFALSGLCGMFGLTIQDPVGRPSLSVSQSGTNALVSWGTNHVGWTLQSTLALNPAAWSTVTPSPSTVGTNFVSTNSLANTAKFFRLTQ
jgi:hypothetical protein